jgi:hypothetical protein
VAQITKLEIMTTIIYLILLSIFLLILYWGFIQLRHKKSQSNLASDELDKPKARLEELVGTKPIRIQEIHRVLLIIRKVAASMLVVAFVFFIVGGVSAEFFPEKIAFTPRDPAILTAIFGWSLWGIAGAIVFISEGIDAILMNGIVARPLPLFTRERFISGRKATLFGVRRIFYGLGFLSIILMFLLVLFGCCNIW